MQGLGIPNLVSLARIVLVAPVVWLLVAYGLHPQRGVRWMALGLFAATAGTDWLDGYLARRLKLETPLGRLLDPLADKLLLIAALLSLAAFPVVDEAAPAAGRAWRPQAWVVAASLIKDVAVCGAYAALHRRESIRAMGPRRIGKLCTFAQMAAVAATLLAPELPSAVAERLAPAWNLTGALAVAALLDYVWVAVQAVQAGDGEPPAATGAKSG